MRRWLACLGMTLLLVLSASAMALAQAQPPAGKGPLGVGPPAAERGITGGRPAGAPVAQVPAGPIDRAWAWILARQAEINRALAQAVLRLKTEGLLVSTAILAGLSFAYGVLHAAGPGHGKAIIASYVLANERTVRRGIFLSFLAALVQALSAIVLVGVLAVAFKATGLKMKQTEAWLETASWGLVALVGAWLLGSQIRRLAWGESGHAHAHGGHGHGSHGHADHTHHGPAHAHQHDHGHGDHVHNPAHGIAGHIHDEHCEHVHMPDPRQLEGELSWRKALAIAFAVGIRPCTGAIVVLVFALSQGLFWAGIFATFAMALGTAITVSALAALAVGSRELAERLGNAFGGDGAGWTRGIRAVAGVGGSAMVLLLGAAFFWATINGQGPL